MSRVITKVKYIPNKINLSDAFCFLCSLWNSNFETLYGFLCSKLRRCCKWWKNVTLNVFKPILHLINGISTFSEVWTLCLSTGNHELINCLSLYQFPQLKEWQCHLTSLQDSTVMWQLIYFQFFADTVCNNAYGQSSSVFRNNAAS